MTGIVTLRRESYCCFDRWQIDLINVVFRMTPVSRRLLSILALLIVPVISLAQVNVQLPDTVAAVGDTLLIPLSITTPLGGAVISSQFEVSYDTSLIKGLEVIIDGVTLPDSAGWKLEFNISAGRISVGMAGADSLIGIGVLSYLKFVVNESAVPNQSSELKIDTMLFNQGSPVAVIQNGSVSVIAVDIDEKDGTNGLVRSFSLSQNYPNPFNPETAIRYSIPKAEEVSLVVYNLIGEEVTHLIGETQRAGYYKVTWDASNVASGIYFYRLQAGNFIQTMKMILLK